MDKEIERLQQSLVITEDEAILLPDDLCHGAVHNTELILVGTVLSPRPYNFEAFKNTIVRVINPLQGMTVRKILMERFVLTFNHIVGRKRALEEEPWHFDRNQVVLAAVNDNDNPSTMPLDTCTFKVHVLDLPLKLMTLNIAIFLGDRLGSFKDVQFDGRAISWGSILKMTVEIDVTKPLKLFLQLNSACGESHVVTFQYERLPNFCYLCGKIGHLAKDCLLRYSEGFKDPGEFTPFGAWLRAPSFNNGGQPSNSNSSMFSERPHYAKTTESQSGSLISRVAQNSEFGAYMNMHQSPPHVKVAAHSRSQYPFSNNDDLIPSASLNSLGQASTLSPSEFPCQAEAKNDHVISLTTEILMEVPLQASPSGLGKRGHGRLTKPKKHRVGTGNKAMPLMIGLKRAPPDLCFDQGSNHLGSRHVGSVPMNMKSCNLESDVRQQLENYLGDQIVDRHVMYLGLPAITGRNKVDAFNYIGERAKAFLTAFCNAQIIGAQNQSTSTSLATWNPPPSGVIKVNFDAAMLGDMGGIGAGVVARDSNELCVRWVCQFFPDIRDPKHAKAMAAREAIELIARGNRVAHSLAKSALSSLEGYVDPPMSVMSLIVSEYSVVA
ncbi:hypothetical protein BUALT_Bualt07G0076800 [Buddleja alternifolia]|uniref:CCHC-type domain-containing protein n=1 Tax=Buddleja alternifolia TaxID=168488 RepID=A0AAV6X946_9LAMI|nr:hypothetical protein BUALT_Bualt07G0076800 [Buddleja alternifolia]